MKKPTGWLRKVQQRGNEIIFTIVSSNEVQWNARARSKGGGVGMNKPTG